MSSRVNVGTPGQKADNRDFVLCNKPKTCKYNLYGTMTKHLLVDSATANTMSAYREVRLWFYDTLPLNTTLIQCRLVFAITSTKRFSCDWLRQREDMTDGCPVQYRSTSGVNASVEFFASGIHDANLTTGEWNYNDALATAAVFVKQIRRK